MKWSIRDSQNRPWELHNGFNLGKDSFFPTLPGGGGSAGGAGGSSAGVLGLVLAVATTLVVVTFAIGHFATKEDDTKKIARRLHAEQVDKTPAMSDREIALRVFVMVQLDPPAFYDKFSKRDQDSWRQGLLVDFERKWGKLPEAAARKIEAKWGKVFDTASKQMEAELGKTHDSPAQPQFRQWASDSALRDKAAELTLGQKLDSWRQQGLDPLTEYLKEVRQQELEGQEMNTQRLTK